MLEPLQSMQVGRKPQGPLGIGGVCGVWGKPPQVATVCTTIVALMPLQVMPMHSIVGAVPFTHVAPPP